jgi:hypothetical protein
MTHKTNYITIKTTNSTNRFTHNRINDDTTVAQIIPKVTSTLSAIKCSCEVVQKDESVSTGAFSLSGHASFYSTSVKPAVLTVSTLGRKSTSVLSKDCHNYAVQQYSSSLLVWRQHDTLLLPATAVLGSSASAMI